MSQARPGGYGIKNFNHIFLLKMKSLNFDGRTLVMGILNLTPDSFSDGGRFIKVGAAVSHAKKMIKEGADIIDIGGESTRPGSQPVSVEEELKRVIPIIEELSKSDTLISIDTYKPEVAVKAVESGASMINDVNGLRTEGMAEVASTHSIPVVVMHMQGTPKNMQEKSHYKNVVDDINSFFEERISYALEKGIKKENIILDPGIGFGKTLEHNLEIIRNLKEFKRHNLPLLVGPSRKSFIGQILDLPADERLEGTLASVVACVLNGADMVRVHDVMETVRAVKIVDAISGR